MARFTVDGNATGAVKAVQDLAKAIEKGEKGFEQAAKGADKLDKAAQRIARNNEGPQEKYNRRMRELAELVNKGKLSYDQAAIAAEKYRGTMERAGKAGQAAFGSRALADMRGFVGQFVGIQMAATAALNAFKALAAEREKAAQSAMSSRGSAGALAQLAATTSDPKAAMASLLAEARALRASGGADTEQQAYETVFDLNSAGLSRTDRDFAGRVKASGVLSDVGGAGRAYAALTTAMGKGEVGDFKGLLSKAIAASAAAPAQANEIPLAAARGAGSAGALGLSDEFLLAATAILARKTGTAAEGGTQVAAFLKQVEKSGLDTTGKSGAEIVAMIGGMSEAQQGIGGVLGDRAEAVAGFRTLRDNMDELRNLESSIRNAEATGLADTAVGLTGGDARLRTANARARAEGSLEQSMGDSAALQNILQAAWAERQRTARADGGSFTEFNLAVERGQLGIVNTLGSDEEKREILREWTREGSVQDTELLKDIRDILSRSVTTRQE